MHYFELTLITISKAITNPIYYLCIYLMYRANKKTHLTTNYFMNTVKMVMYSLIFGSIGTIILYELNIKFSFEDFLYVLPLSLILLLFNKRFMCLAYSCGIICCIQAYTNKLGINCFALLTIVAVLHLFEGLLIIIDGYDKVNITHLNTDEFGRIGYYSFEKTWIIPLSIVIIGTTSARIPWDFSSYVFPKEIFTVIFEPVFLIFICFLGYKDFSYTKSPKEKVRTTGALLISYGLILEFILLMSIYINFFIYFACIFCIVGHEIIILLGIITDQGKKPFYINNSSGVYILEVSANSEAEKIGIKPGSTIWKVNNTRVYYSKDLKKILDNELFDIIFYLSDIYGRNYQAHYNSNTSTLINLGVTLLDRSDGLYHKAYFEMDNYKEQNELKNSKIKRYYY